jgi:serine/threonine protein kinase
VYDQQSSWSVVMRAVNRFLELAKTSPNGVRSLDHIFHGASVSESSDITEALYVIGEMRANSGDPVRIDEITSAIGPLVSDPTIVEAAVDICLKGLVSTGCSADHAIQQLLDSTDTLAGESHVASMIGPHLQDLAESNQPHGIDLPKDFGPPVETGRLRYELRRLIGRGSQGYVYEAHDRTFSEEGVPSFVAIKVFHKQESKRFIQEGTRSRRIRHKNIARVFDQGVSESREHFISYEMIHGLTLDLWLNQRKENFTARDACSLVISIASGVQSAHNAGIVHRDLKPTNILVNKEDEPVVTDFGISLDMNQNDLVSQYGARGSLAYMAPEQYDGMMDGPMPSADIYALGGILFWLVSGKYPNGDSVSEAVDWLESRCDGGPHRIVDWGVPRRLQAILERALCVDPADRYQSVEIFANDLQSYLEHQPIDWLDRSSAERCKLFIKRRPSVVISSLLVIILMMTSVVVWINARASIQIEHQRSLDAIEIQGLQNQVVLEQARIEEIKEKSAFLKTIVETWNGVINASDEPGQIEKNLMFLHSMTISEFVRDDPLLFAGLLEKKLSIGQEYLAMIESNGGSKLQIAMWHEVLAEWAMESDRSGAHEHLLTAIDLVEEYGSDDEFWLDRLSARLERLELQKDGKTRSGDE